MRSIDLETILLNSSLHDIVFWIGAGVDADPPTGLPVGNRLIRHLIKIYFLTNPERPSNSETDYWENQFSKHSKRIDQFLSLFYDELPILKGRKGNIESMDHFLRLETVIEILSTYKTHYQGYLLNKEAGKLYYIHGQAKCFESLGFSLKSVFEPFPPAFSQDIEDKYKKRSLFFFLGYGAGDDFDVNLFFKKLSHTYPRAGSMGVFLLHGKIKKDGSLKKGKLSLKQSFLLRYFHGGCDHFSMDIGDFFQKYFSSFLFSDSYEGSEQYGLADNILKEMEDKKGESTDSYLSSFYLPFDQLTLEQKKCKYYLTGLLYYIFHIQPPQDFFKAYLHYVGRKEKDGLTFMSPRINFFSCLRGTGKLAAVRFSIRFHLGLVDSNEKVFDKLMKIDESSDPWQAIEPFNHRIKYYFNLSCFWLGKKTKEDIQRFQSGLPHTSCYQDHAGIIEPRQVYVLYLCQARIAAILGGSYDSIFNPLEQALNGYISSKETEGILNSLWCMIEILNKLHYKFPHLIPRKSLHTLTKSFIELEREIGNPGKAAAHSLLRHLYLI